MPADLEELHAVQILGSGDATVVLSHGFGCNQSSWRRILPMLTDRYRVLLYDLMGCNARNAPFFDAMRYRSVDAYAHDLIAILDRAKLPPVHYVGHSVSGMIGVLASLERPELFGKLILINPSPCYLNRSGYTGGFSQADIQNLLNAVIENYHAWAQSFAPVAISQEPGEPAVEEFAEGILAMRPDIALSMLLVVFNSDLRERLRHVTVPAVIVQSTRDPIVPCSVAAFICGAIAACTVELIDAPGHLPHLTHPDLLFRALAPHLP